jgi:hypothetical protein
MEFENTVLRRIFGPTKVGVTHGRGELDYEEVGNVFIVTQ